jgi:hypothetical protein
MPLPIYTPRKNSCCPLHRILGRAFQWRERFLDSAGNQTLDHTSPSLITSPELAWNSKLYEEKPVNRHIHRVTHSSHKKQRTWHMKVIWDCLTTTVQLQRHWKGRMTMNEESEACRRNWSWSTWRYLAFAEGMKRIHKRISLKICRLLSMDTMKAQVWNRCANSKLVTFDWSHPLEFYIHWVCAL